MNATPLSDKMFELIARRFRMLGEPYRLRILHELQSGEKTVTDLVDALDGNQPNVSKHLQLLHEAGLVARRREGNSIFYAISDPMVFKLCDLVCRSEAQRTRQEFNHWSGIATQSRTTTRK